MHGSAPWKTEETIVGLPRLLVLSVFSRSDSPDLVAVTFHPHQRRPRKLPRLQAPVSSPPRHPPPRRPLSAPARLALLQELSERVAADLTQMGLRPMIGYDRTNENQGS